ncbi:hypothetical protein L7F22_065104 [Adiantum nelumboides]|nr:hypothetical protein [Adiantum nelumboides]
MCCLVRRKSKPPPPHSSARHSRSSHGELQHESLSSSMFASSATELSSTSTTSIASIKDILSDGPSVFRFEEICLATCNFDPAQKVGRSVWKASLHNRMVAISRKQGRARNFTSVLSRVRALHHQNLVKLLGACHEGDYIYLVYDFMESSNLRDCLRSKLGVSFSALSSWISRIRVALDVAKGLEYLHHMSSPPLIHKHIDSRNILVGNDLRAKVAHVGVSVLTGEVEFANTKVSVRLPENDAGEIQPEISNRRMARSQSVKIHGIQGYMPPEYLRSGEVSSKYDVFAFGVILAEIISGREAAPSVYEQSKSRQAAKPVSLPDYLLSVMTGDDSKSKLRRWMDPLLRDSFPLDDAHRVASTATACLDPDPLKRPDMSDVGLRLQKLLASAEKYDATIGAQRELMTASLQPR